jgi:hypothetical protein
LVKRDSCSSISTTPEPPVRTVSEVASA